MAVADVTQKAVADLLSLSGRSAVVTGGAQGLGKAIARRLAEAGAKVLILDLSEERASAAADELAAAFGGTVRGMAADVTDSAQVRAAAEFASREFGSLDVWVNNAGIYPNQTLFNQSDEVWGQVLGVNLSGVLYGAREAARQMVAAGKGGVIINIVSTAGFSGVAPGVSAYVATKHGVRGLTKQLAIELAPHDIRVLGVAPTFCTTEGNSAALAALPERVREEIAATVTSKLGRVGVPDDIARVVLFAASDMAMFMTGSTILADAGEVS